MNESQRDPGERQRPRGTERERERERYIQRKSLLEKESSDSWWETFQGNLSHHPFMTKDVFLRGELTWPRKNY
jgi:hypothetical protein